MVNIFAKNTHIYPTEVQRQIYMEGLRLTPLEVSLADTNGFSQEFIEGCRQYHSFTSNMLWDMYCNPKLKYCTACSTSHEGGGFTTVLGRKVRLCAGINFRLKNPDLSQYDFVKELIDIRAEIIDEQKKKKVVL